MKKVYALLIVLISLSLLDGLPIHNCHSKFISVRSKTSVHESSDNLSAIYTCVQDIVDDNDNDDEDLNLIAHRSTAYSESRKLPTLIHSIYSTPSNIASIPLYTLWCDFRI